MDVSFFLVGGRMFSDTLSIVYCRRYIFFGTFVDSLLSCSDVYSRKESLKYSVVVFVSEET